jgi:hypothetical protein
MAFLRIAHNHIDPDKYAAVLEEIQPLVAAAEAESPGLRYRFVARDMTTGDSILATVWDTREQAEAGVVLSDEVRAKLAASGRVVGQIEVAEITHDYVRGSVTA